jgi:DNA modification methylase
VGYPSSRIFTADVFSGLRRLADQSVQCCITSPPYWGLRDYGVAGQLGLEPTPEEYVARIVAAFRAVRRVLRDDGTLWLNLGDSYATGGGKVGECPGGGKQGERYRGDHGPDPKAPRIGPHTQPNRMPLAGLKPKDLVGIPWRVAFALQADGWYLRSDIIWHKSNPMPESVRDRPTKSHEYLFLLSKSERYFYHADAIKEPTSRDSHARYARGRGSAHKYADGGPGNQSIAKSFDHMTKVPAGWHQGSRGAGSAPRDRRAPGVNPKCAEPGSGIKHNSSFCASVIDVGDFRNKRTVWKIATQSFKGAHFATFPQKLVEPCLLAGSAPGDLVLDPFCGAGTVGLVAQTHGRGFVGIELKPEYARMARERIAGAARGACLSQAA